MLARSLLGEPLSQLFSTGKPFPLVIRLQLLFNLHRHHPVASTEPFDVQTTLDSSPLASYLEVPIR